MKVNIREDHVEIEGYVNAIERNSKILYDRAGKFIEKVSKGAFKRALQRNDDVHILLNHNWKRDLGSTKQGNLELEEDNIGLKARATINDPEVIKTAKNGDLVGWSFGFYDVDTEKKNVDGILNRTIKDLDLLEVSILDRTRSPAYEGTLVMARSQEEGMQFTGENFIDEIELNDLSKKEPSERAKTAHEIDYSKYENLIKEIKEF